MASVSRRAAWLGLAAALVGVTVGTPGVGMAGDPPVEADAASFTDRVDALLAEETLADAQVSVFVRDLDSGKTLYARDEGTALNPASNVKLITTAAALQTLGAEHRYPTRVYAERVSRGVVEGPIYLVGGGDPSLVTGDLYELAALVRAAGVTQVEGGIVVDASRFDRDGFPPGFDQKQEFAAYRAPGGATAVNFDTFEIRSAVGGAVGSKPEVRIVPNVRSIVVENRAKVVAGKKNRLGVDIRTEGKRTTVTVSGSVGTEARPARWRFPVSDPSPYAGDVFNLVLRQAGVKVSSGAVKRGEAPNDARLIATHNSEPLSVLIRSVNKLSNNFMAEQILRTLDPSDGATAETSLIRLRQWAGTTGMPMEDLVLGNGSGLYDNNRLSAQQIVAALEHVYADFRVRSDYLASLAVMGIDGTTSRRLDDSSAEGWVRAKTGTLDGVSALSGFAGAPGRHPVAFSILVNDFDRWKIHRVRSAQDGIVRAIVDSLH
jgi:D-alanyl-D-alanine carboxypeptidase/D-alanyl-D-alanine-endopeptidase (penicillin-binding protein 4)